MSNEFDLTEEELKALEHLKPKAASANKTDARKKAGLITLLYAVFLAPLIMAAGASIALGEDNLVAMGIAVAIAAVIAVWLGVVIYKKVAKTQLQKSAAENEEAYKKQEEIYQNAIKDKVAQKKTRITSTICEFCGGTLDFYVTGANRDEKSYRDGFTLQKDYSSYSSKPAYTVKEHRVNYSEETGTEITYCKHCKYAIELDYSSFCASGGYPLKTYKARRVMLRNGCTLNKEQVENGRLAAWLPKPKA